MPTDNKALFAAAQFELETKNQSFARSVIQIARAFKAMSELEDSTFTFGKILRKRIGPHKPYYKRRIEIGTSVARVLLDEWSEQGRSPSAMIMFGPNHECRHIHFHGSHPDEASFASEVIRQVYRLASRAKQIPPMEYSVSPSLNTHGVWRDLKIGE